MLSRGDRLALSQRVSVVAPSTNVGVTTVRTLAGALVEVATEITSRIGTFGFRRERGCFSFQEVDAEVGIIRRPTLVPVTTPFTKLDVKRQDRFERINLKKSGHHVTVQRKISPVKTRFGVAEASKVTTQARHSKEPRLR